MSILLYFLTGHVHCTITIFTCKWMQRLFCDQHQLWLYEGFFSHRWLLALFEIISSLHYCVNHNLTVHCNNKINRSLAQTKKTCLRPIAYKVYGQWLPRWFCVPSGRHIKNTGLALSCRALQIIMRKTSRHVELVKFSDMAVQTGKHS